MQNSVRAATVKFKTRAINGKEYIHNVCDSMIMLVLRKSPKIFNIAIYKENFTFTPDDFMAATRKH